MLVVLQAGVEYDDDGCGSKMLRAVLTGCGLWWEVELHGNIRGHILLSYVCKSNFDR